MHSKREVNGRHAVSPSTQGSRSIAVALPSDHRLFSVSNPNGSMLPPTQQCMEGRADAYARTQSPETKVMLPLVPAKARLQKEAPKPHMSI